MSTSLVEWKFMIYFYSSSGTVSIPKQLTGFQMHAVIPLLNCLMSTVTQPQLCHATLSVLLQVRAPWQYHRSGAFGGY